MARARVRLSSTRQRLAVVPRFILLHHFLPKEDLQRHKFVGSEAAGAAV
jgi:hypothetical protein